MAEIKTRVAGIIAGLGGIVRDFVGKRPGVRVFEMFLGLLTSTGTL